MNGTQDNLWMFVKYFFQPAFLFFNARMALHNHHYGMAALWAAYLVFWIWRYPWFVMLVVKSFLGIA